MSNKASARSKISQATTTSSRRKEVQFSGSSLPTLEEADSSVKRPRSHSNPAKKVESFYAVRDKLRETSNSKPRVDPRIYYKPDIRPPKAGSEASHQRSSSLRSNSSITSTSSVKSSTSVKSVPVSKNSSAKSVPVSKTSNSVRTSASSHSVKISSVKTTPGVKTISGVRNIKPTAPEAKSSLEEIEVISTDKSSLVSQLKALSSGIMNIQPEAGSKKYIPIESTPPEELKKSKQKSEHGSLSKSSNGPFSSQTVLGKVEKNGKRGTNNSDVEEEVVTNGHVMTQQPHCSTSHGALKVPQPLNGLLSGSSQLTTEEAQPLLLPANRVVSTGVCKWFQCCPVTASDHRGSSAVMVEPDY